MQKRSKKIFYVELGFRIRQMRNLNKMTQEYLGERLGVSSQTMQRYETGEIQIPSEAVAKCARVLHTPIGYLYGEDGQHPAPSNTNRIGLLVASEIMDLPDETIRKNVFHLVRSIVRWSEKKDKGAV